MGDNMVLHAHMDLYFDIDYIPKETILKLVQTAIGFNWNLNNISHQQQESINRTSAIKTNDQKLADFVSNEREIDADGSRFYLYEDLGEYTTIYQIHMANRLSLRQDENYGRLFRYSGIFITFHRFPGFEYVSKFNILCNATDAYIGIFSIGPPTYEKELDNFLRGISDDFIPTGHAFYLDKQFCIRYGLEKMLLCDTRYIIEINNKYRFGTHDPSKPWEIQYGH
jgi:hypothetical protein